VRFLPIDLHDETPDALDPGHNADGRTRGLEPGALLDVRFEIGERLHLREHRARQRCDSLDFGQRGCNGFAVAVFACQRRL
jgi:hypothetical protein